MITVTVDVVHDALTSSQKRELIHRMTQAANAVQGDALSEMVCVRINELGEGNVALGGKPLRALDLHYIAAERALLASSQSSGPSRETVVVGQAGHQNQGSKS